MIRLFLLILFCVINLQAAPVNKSTTQKLEIITTKDNLEIQLPETAFKILRKWNPEFVLLNKSDFDNSIYSLFKEQNIDTLPMAFIEDLDGNNQKDIVLLGADLKNKYAIAILQLNKKWTLLKLAQWPMYSAKEKSAIVYVLPAIGEQADHLKKIKKIGIQIETYMGSSEVFEIKDAKAIKFSL